MKKFILIAVTLVSMGCKKNEANYNTNKGDTGLPGEIGATGPQGQPGPQGSMGLQGLPGLNGATGTQGPAGAKGATGATGIQGAIGPTGLTGVTGPTGPAGLSGATLVIYENIPQNTCHPLTAGVYVWHSGKYIWFKKRSDCVHGSNDEYIYCAQVSQYTDDGASTVCWIGRKQFTVMGTYNNLKVYELTFQ